METFERLKAIAEKFRLSKEDKEFVAPLAEEHGIAIDKRCPDCWRDAAIQLAIIYKPEEVRKEAGGYVLRKGIDITLYSFNHGKLHICEALLTKENAEKWLAAGMPARFFEKMPEQNADNE